MAVKFPTSYLVLAALGVGIPFGTVNPVSAADEQAAGYLTPPGGRILVGEIPCVISDTAITAKNASGAASAPPVGDLTPAPRSNLVKPKACRVLFGTLTLAEKPRLPVDALAVEGPSNPPADDLVQSMERIIDNMAETIAIAESTLNAAPRMRSPFGLKSAAGPVIAKAVKRDLAASFPSDPIEYHSDEDVLRFVSAIITPLGSDDHDASLLPIIEEDGEVGEWSMDSPSDADQMDREDTTVFSDSFSRASFSLEDTTYIAGSANSTEIQSTTDGPGLSDQSDGAYSPVFVYAAATAAPAI